MVVLHLGRAGRLWDKAAELAEQAKKSGVRTLMLVPQHDTLQAERDLMEALRVPGFFDLDVLSPGRLMQRVFAQVGEDARVRIDARGKAMAVAGALLRCKAGLSYYESAADRQGFADRMGALIADFKRALITPENLRAYADGLPEGAQKEKISDLALIYETYASMLTDKFVDGEDVQDVLNARVREAELMRGTRLLVYGFDVLTGQMARLLCACADIVESLHVFLYDDPADEAFSPVTESVERFEALLHAADIPLKREMHRGVLNAPPDIQALEKGLLCAGPAPYTGTTAAVRLYAAPTPFAEAHFVAREMLLKNQAGIPFSAMQVLCCSEERYFSTLDAVLTSYRIPHYLARKVCAARLGAAAFLLSALRAAASDFRSEDVLAAVRTGYLPLTEDECFRMENYILAYGIRFSLFTRPFTRGGSEGEALEEARERMMAPLILLRDELKNAQNADEALDAMMHLLTDTGAYAHLQRDADALEQNHLSTEAAQLRQVWKTLMELLDQMHELLSGAELTGSVAADWLEAGLEQTELSALPQDAGSAVCGLVGNVALTHPRVVFIMGLNDGAFSVSDNGLLSADEVQDVQQAMKTYLSLDADGRELLSRLDIYKAFASPSQALYISHAQALQDGTALRPHMLLRQVRLCLPALIEEGGVTAAQGPSLPLSKNAALEGLGAYLRFGDLPDMWRGAWHYLCEHDKQSARALLLAFEPPKPSAPLPANVTHRLFLERILSINRLETYAVCPFKHFVRYGLKPVERRDWAVRPQDTGSFYHAALEGFTSLLPSVPEWPGISKKTCDALIDKAAQPVMEQLLGDRMKDSARVRRAGDRYRRLLRRVAWTFTLTARQSAFRPTDAEVRFGFDDGALPPVRLRLSDGSQVLVRGIIDRIDRYEDDAGVYLRVVDYKSADTSLSPQRVFYGTQLQLLMYLLAALQGEPGALPAGAFYFHLADPLLPDPRQQTDIEQKLAQALSLTGVTLRDVSIIRLMDSGDPPLSMQKLLTKDGEFAKNKQLATLEQMRGLILHAKKTAVTLAESIASGNTAASPLETAPEDSPCRTCDYRSICRRDAFLGCVTPRACEKMSFDELLEAVSGAAEREDQSGSIGAREKVHQKEE